MTQTGSRLVAVITPVYNGGAFLAKCIDSVLNQTHRNIDYYIVDNCSTDDSLAIARDAAARDDRITVVEAGEHVGPIQNWNRSLANIQHKHEFVKFVHADDWLFPECIQKLLSVAASDDRIGMVSSYRLEEDRVSLDRLPSRAPLVASEEAFVMDGREVGRAILAEHASVLGSPTSILFRTRAIGDPCSLFSTEFLHADKEACLRLLQSCDFGFVRQVLAYTRRHNESVTSLTRVLDTRRQENLLFLKKYGPVFLSGTELETALQREENSYYRFLAGNVATGKSRQFWDSHETVLQQAGLGFSRFRVFSCFLRRWLNPALAAKELADARSVRRPDNDTEAYRFLEMSRRQDGVRDDAD